MPAILLPETVFESLPHTISRRTLSNEQRQHLADVLTTLSLTFASVSVLSTLVALYWFVKMKRNFRHESSDFIKSMAAVIFSVVSLTRGPVRSESAFCQVTGFAFTLGIESSDIAVLLIAIHSAMYIFRPKSGLYPYRQVAYLAYYLSPVITSSLAFIRGNGYENLGHYCYLRSDSGHWNRLMLSWVPRYIICICIVGIYAFIYIYILWHMGDWRREQSELQQTGRRSASSTVPSSPHLCCPDWLISPSSSRRTSATDTIAASKGSRQRTGSVVSNIAQQNFPGSQVSKTQTSQPWTAVHWRWSGFGQTHSGFDSRPSLDHTTEPIPPDAPPISAPPPAHTSDPTSPDPENTHINTSSSDQAHSKPTISRALHRQSQTSHETEQAGTDSSLIQLQSVVDDPAMLRHRERIRKQLRSLFVYPLVYVIVWLFPFISHVVNAETSVYRGDRPAWLLVVSIVSICSQGTADCALFMAREKPWRHSAGRGFWESMGRRIAWSWGGRWFGKGGVGSGDRAGRIREEMLVDGRLARERRQEEIQSERNNVGRSRSKEQGNASMEWWDRWDEEREPEGRRPSGAEPRQSAGN
ncbi:uncharacterized protein CTHT_0035600 [Thermochaetoides thermophila DSM 1495]|uniref:Uncharacterized protein n=1 Tax=Chaetomium thermophilum (strain DSM 1495 / CBS 144.50 / IMI 039719) TaxID=759272 RepID=G0S6Z6_CHATD|nr:hypothetical protein CTHT_0035600 [Thermochaetoides thermophila DSM 1495]EGS21694.1 hypothetical protein CTHT_0035600 [Thermochaetoides thermophila DSM 1495]